MKKYRLSILINGRKQDDVIKRSRVAAERVLNSLLLNYDLQVEDIIIRDNGHWQEFVCNNTTRFVINRISA